MVFVTFRIATLLESPIRTRYSFINVTILRKEYKVLIYKEKSLLLYLISKSNTKSVSH